MLGLELRHLDDEHGLRFVEAAVLDRELLHQRGLLGADVEVGLRRPAHHVGEAGEVAGVGRRHRVEAGDDPARRGRLGGRAGDVRLLRFRRPCPRRRARDRETPEHRISYQRSYAGWPGCTATNVPRQVAVTSPPASSVASTVARSSAASTTRAVSRRGSPDGVGRRKRTA